MMMIVLILGRTFHLRVTKDFFGSGYSVRFRNHDELWEMRSSCLQSSKFLSSLFTELSNCEAKDHFNFEKKMRSLDCSVNSFPSFSSLSSLCSEVSKLVGVNKEPIGEFFYENLWFSILFVPFLLGLSYILDLIMKWILR